MENLQKLQEAFFKTGCLLEKAVESFATPQTTVVEGVEKSYTAPASNYTITNQNIGGVLPPDVARLFFTTVVSQNEFLKGIRKVETNAMLKQIDVNNMSGSLVQVPEGTDPSSGDFAVAGNEGFNAYLQSVQFFYKITFEEMATYAQNPNYKSERLADMMTEFSNQLTELALTGSASGANLDIKAYSWITGTTFRGAPYIGLQGILEFIDNGYSITKRSSDGSAKTISVGGRVSTYDTTASKFKSVSATIKELIKAYPRKYRGTDVVIFLSDNDLLDLQIEMAESTTELVYQKELNIYKYLGYTLVPIRQLASINEVVTVSNVDYYPGMILMGRMKDMIMIQNTVNMTYGEQLDVLKRQYAYVNDAKIAFCAIPQRFAIACYRPVRQ